jgi:hypothetical protein
MVGIIAGCEGSEPKASGPYNRRQKMEYVLCGTARRPEEIQLSLHIL